MSVVTVTLPNDGDVALVEPYNAAIDAILAQVNGNLDDNNIVSMNGSKIIAGSLPSTAFSAAANKGWLAIPNSLTYGANNGQKEFTVTAAADLTGILNAGMKISVTRGTVPPTHCMAFVAASSQYASVSSPAGLSFTGTYTCEAWVYLNSYSSQAIISCYNGTNGFGLELNNVGQLQIVASSTTFQTSFSSVPLGKWVHVAGTFSAGTMVLYMNGVIMPSTKSGSGTSITQAGALQVGAANSTLFFDGNISEARIWSVAQTQSAVQSNMAINLVGNETNLVTLFKGDAAWTDGTSNANTLTPQAGAVNNYLANPYNAVEYGIVTAISYSNPTTTIKVFTGGGGTIPNQSLTTPIYSLLHAPYGFPMSKNLWKISSINRSSTNSTSNSTYGAFGAGLFNLQVPTGSWTVGHQHGDLFNTATTKVNFNISSVALTGLSATVGQSTSAFAIQTKSSAAAEVDISGKVEHLQTLSSLTTYVMYTFGASASAGIDGTAAVSEIYAVCEYI